MKCLCVVVLMTLALGSGASAATVGRIALAPDAPLASATLVLRIEQGLLRARLEGSARDLWRVAATPSGLQIHGGDSPPACGGRVWATLDLAQRPGEDGVSAHVYVSGVFDGADGPAAHITALRLDARGNAAIEWTHSARTLPALGEPGAAPALVVRGETRSLVMGSGWPRDPAAAARTPGSLLQLDARTGAARASLLQSAASFPGGATAIDLDADGDTDRIYAVDGAWQVWRVDFAGGAWRGSRLADLSSARTAGAALTFPPDVSLERRGSPVLDVALASSNAPRQRAAAHWLWILRDPWRAGAIPPPAPITPADLAVQGSVHGSVTPLSGPATSAPLTVGGLVRVATTSTTPVCRLTFDVPEVELEVTSVPTNDRGDARDRPVLRETLTARADDGPELSWPSTDVPASAPAAECRIGERVLLPCPIGPRLARRYWRRSDAP